MLTLDSWDSLWLHLPNIIECPEMRLISSHDHESPIFVGSGHIDISVSSPGVFTMYASSADVREASDRLRRARNNPYEITDQFRLLATDYKGTEWNCGWTVPEVKGMPHIGWPLTGKIGSLATVDKGTGVARESGVELVFQPSLWLPMDTPMVSITSVNGKEIERNRRPGQQQIQVLASEIRFFHKPKTDALWITATTSDKLQHPYLENWIAEPFRILFGQFLLPRLTARNFGDGTAQICLNLRNSSSGPLGAIALVRNQPLQIRAKLWETYASLLALIAESKDKQGQLNFNPNPITRFYEEIIQANQGSRWILCMTLASASEGLANLLMQPEERKSDFAQQELDSLEDWVKKWKGNEKLQGRILGEITRASQRSIGAFLRNLVGRNILEKKHADAWIAVRNAVMHGNLIAPWGTKEGDERLTALIDLVHRLTGELIIRRPLG
jgi:hypothetical protein